MRQNDQFVVLNERLVGAPLNKPKGVEKNINKQNTKTNLKLSYSIKVYLQKENLKQEISSILNAKAKNIKSGKGPITEAIK